MRITLFTIGRTVLLCALATIFAPSLRAQRPTPAPDLTCSPTPCVFPDVMVSQGGYFLSNHVIVANPSNANDLVVAAQDENCLNTSFVGIFSSEDAGTSWVHHCLPVQTGAAATSGAPMAGYDTNNVVYAGGINYGPNGQASRLVLASSLDNGLHWNSPVTVVNDATSPQLAIDTNTNSPFCNQIYVLSLNTISNQQNIAVSRSSDGGKTWTSQEVVRGLPGALTPGNVAIASDGTAYMTWSKCTYVSESGCTAQKMFLKKSTDGGATWGARFEIDGTLIGILFGVGNPSYAPIVAVDNSAGPHAGTLYVIFPRATNFIKLGVVRSTDGGVTWSQPSRITSSFTGDKFGHWISVAADGTVGVTWLDSRQDEIHYQPYYATSSDGGVTFTGDQPLSSVLEMPDEGMGYLRTHVWVGNALYATWNTGVIGHQIVLGGVQF